MIVDLEVGGRRYRVSVHSREAGATTPQVEVTLEERDAGATLTPDVLSVNVRRTATGWTLVHADGRVVDAALADLGRGRLLVHLPHCDVPVQVGGPRRHEADGGLAGAAVGQRLEAPMPGRILRVLVAEGDEVAAGQGLVIMEAMKMENALTADGAGRVQSILVAEGDLVEAGRLLMTVE